MSLSIARLGWNTEREILLSTQHYAQSVCDLSSPPVLPVRIGYITFKYVGYACICVTASDPRRRTTGRCFSTSGMLHLHPGPVSTGFGFSARFRAAALRPSGGVMMLLLLLPTLPEQGEGGVISLSPSLSVRQRVSRHHHSTCAHFQLIHCTPKMQHFFRALTEASPWSHTDKSAGYKMTQHMCLCRYPVLILLCRSILLQYSSVLTSGVISVGPEQRVFRVGSECCADMFILFSFFSPKSSPPLHPSCVFGSV